MEELIKFCKAYYNEIDVFPVGIPCGWATVYIPKLDIYVQADLNIENCFEHLKQYKGELIKIEKE